MTAKNGARKRPRRKATASETVAGIGVAVKKCREVNGWTQEQMAAAVSKHLDRNLTQQAVALWERGDVMPTGEVMLALSRMGIIQ